MGIRNIVEGEKPTDSVDVIEPVEEQEEIAAEANSEANGEAEETPDEVIEVEPKAQAEVIPEPVVEDSVVDEEVEKKQKAVHALTLEEKRLREKIVALHAERRKASDPVFKAPEVFVNTKPEVLADVADSDVELIEKVLRAKGYVKKDELQSMTHAEKLETYKDSWLKEHPEYLPANDPDDVKWGALTQEINYYRQPSKPEDVIVLLNKAHAALNPHSLPVKNQAQMQAAKEKLNSSSKGAGGTSSKSTPSVAKAVDQSLFKGFTAEELAEMGIK